MMVSPILLRTDQYVWSRQIIENKERNVDEEYIKS